MQLTADNIKKLISKMRFIPQNGKNNVYVKSYPLHNEYTIRVDFNDDKIEYYTQDTLVEDRIVLGDGTTSNFAHAENFVVLECVDRLLEKGYAPSCIGLEKTYPSGRGHSGRLDILVSTAENIPYLMIECKTWGTEYEKEYKKMLKDGGQLFTYFTNDRAVKYLCLYTSRLGKTVEYKNAIVDVEDSWRELSGTKEIYGHWNKNFKDNGVFESYAAPYDIKHKALTYGMLKNLKEEDSGKIFNQIMEILRHNAISDKPNAFNKLLNLFVCKIIDENKNPDDELEFQWLETDTDESLQMRLNDLYKNGMWRFLEIRVIDHSEDDVSNALEGIDNVAQKQRLMDMFRDARLKKSPNFAFAEVLDEKTFKLNAKIICEIVELLQVYKFRYEQKHEFLGSFFELLLNTSMKQEAGQYFTPVPITRFIISSLPLKEFSQSKIDSRNPNILPSLIDYACGSGHFLTEYMEQMQRVIDTKLDVDSAAPDVRRQVNVWQNAVKFAWAKDSVYGIDLDNRLVKTTKVSAFFNGDGEANIVWANGLDNFEKASEYRGLLAKYQPYNQMDNGQFDILISNPPYSVEAFKSTLKYGEESFELYNSLTDNSSEIECLFVERMKQLLKVGGWAGVILPSSILSNSGIHSKAREIIFKYFKIKAVVELGSGTFMKTGTNTVVLFLERRSDNDFVAIEKAINKFVSDLKDVTVLGIENAFSKYVVNAYDDIEFEDYISFINGKTNATMQKHELYLDYSKAFGADVYTKAIELEREKIFYFLLTYSQNIVLVKTGQKKEEKAFLGYEFTERRGHEGIKFLPGGTKLFDENGDLLNPQKANSYIYNAFLGKTVSIDEGLARNVSYGRMSGFINYGTSKFDKVVNLNKTLKYKPESQYPLISVRELSTMITKGTTPTTIGFDFVDTGINFVKIENISNTGEFLKEFAHITPECHNKMSRSQLQKDDILFSIAGSFGRISIVQDSILPANTNQALAIIRGVTPNIILKYFVELLRSNFISPQINKFAKGIAQYNLSLQEVGNIIVPLPPLDIQNKIVAEIEVVDEGYNKTNLYINRLRQRAEALYDNPNISSNHQHIGQIAECNPSKSELLATPDNTVISFVEMASVSNEGYIASAVDRPFSEVRKGSYTYFREDDIIIAKITPCMENGKCALAVNLTNGIGMGSSEFHVIRCSDIVIPRYLFGFLNRQTIREEAERKMTGMSGHRRVPISFYEQLSIPLPSLADQQKVVAEIEQIDLEIEKAQASLIDLKEAKNNVLAKYL